MPYVASQSIVVRDRGLVGLKTLLDAELTARAMVQCGVPLEGTLQIDYLRYKPGRRCISLVSTSMAGKEQQFVLSAFIEPEFVKQCARNSDAVTDGKCWQHSVQLLRIDRFPFDLGLKHIEKCFESSQRSRLLRRILGDDSHHDQIRLESLAYKPGRRYVASGRITTGTSASTDPEPTRESAINTEPSNTFKFYTATQFSQTLRRLQASRSAYTESPRIVASHEHYKVIVMEWIYGELLADLLAGSQELDSLLFEVGLELARLHSCFPSHDAPSAVAAHGLQDIASYIGFIRPDQAELAAHTVNEATARLSESRNQQTLIHGDFYAKQVLVDRGTVRFIDFDQAGLGNPYQDVGNFVAKLYWQRLAVGESLWQAEEIAKPFLRGYRSGVRTFCDRAYDAHLSAGLIRCATHPFRRVMVDWPDAMRQLLMLAQSVMRKEHSSQGSVSIA